MKRTVREMDLKNKKVIIRVDFNVPIKDGIILDDNRIISSLETINYAIDNNAKVILMSHLGRIKEESDKVKNDLSIVAKRLEELLNRKVLFVNETRGTLLEEAINNLNEKDVLLMQNTRYEDLDGKKESKNDAKLGKYWASLGDVFINDAFGTTHRSHASNVGIASNIPSAIGFLIEKELKNLDLAINNPEKPFSVILGGAKVSDKITVIENLLKKADYILIGGAMANTFLSANLINVGNSKVESDFFDYCSKLLKENEDKIILPIDGVVAKSLEDINATNKFITDILEDDMILDIGTNTVKLFNQYLEMSKTIVWNGPVGVSEIEQFSNGTKSICQILAELDAKTIIGGGDSASAVINFGYEKDMTHISTGGGSSLKLLEGSEMPGIDCIEESGK
ncbi:MAG: phosphoglycerate kinase [Mycoplasmatota bacterium]